MKISCYSIFCGSSYFLGGIKQNHKSFSIFVQDRKRPFDDVLQGNQDIVFSSYSDAYHFLNQVMSPDKIEFLDEGEF